MKGSKGGYRYTFSERRRRKERVWRRLRSLSLLAVTVYLAFVFLGEDLSSVVPPPEQQALLDVPAKTVEEVIAADNSVLPAVEAPKPKLKREKALDEVPLADLPPQNQVQTQRARLKREPVVTSKQKIDEEAEFFSRLLAEIKEEDLRRGYYTLSDGTQVELSIDAEIQEAANKVLQKYEVPWGAVVAIEPSTGRILALSSHSELDPLGEDVVLRSGMPAASLFKVVTAAAAIEVAGLEEDTEIYYRGGDHTLNRSNYLASASRDTRKISLGRALAKSCNPAFARLATEYLSADILKQYADAFAFSSSLSTGLPVALSSYSPVEGTYQLARTAAGFGKAELGPIHAAAIAGAVANGGKLMRPRIVDKVVSASGEILFQARDEMLKRSVSPDTARQLLAMMEDTVTSGTARRQFRRSRVLRKVRIAAKTGTLSGDSPKGRYHWLIAAAPADAPEIALAAVVIDPGKAKINGTAVARLVLEEYFTNRGV